MDKQKLFVAALNAVPKINTECWQKITGYFEKPEDAWGAKISELQEARVPEKFIVELMSFRKNNKPDVIWENLKREGIDIVCIHDPEYPTLLKEIFNPPQVLYYKGSLDSLNKKTVAIVGSRKCTDYGKRITQEISEQLAKEDVTVISGLALGIDTIAHLSAVKNGTTVAVLANGLDRIYPTSNTALSRTIIEKGALISEYPPGMPPFTQNFPARNRLISGLSSGVLVTESGEKSGTIHTANFALEQNRQIYAIPGPIYNPLSKGPNRLIKMGAKIVVEAGDILEDFGVTKEAIKQTPDNDDEALVFELLKNEPLHIDNIALKSESSVQEISQILSLMELNGKIAHLGGMVYALK